MKKRKYSEGGVVINMAPEGEAEYEMENEGSESESEDEGPMKKAKGGMVNKPRGWGMARHKGK